MSREVARGVGAPATTMILVVAEQAAEQAAPRVMGGRGLRSGDRWRSAGRSDRAGRRSADAAAELNHAIVEAVHLVDSALLEPYTADGYTEALQHPMTQLKPTHVLMPHTYRTRDFAPKPAARLDRALVT